MAIYHTKECKLSSPKVFMGFFTIFTLIFYAWNILVIIISMYPRENMILATKIIKIGLLRLKLWPFFEQKSVEIFWIQGFHGYLTIFPLKIYAWVILVIILSIHICESMILTTKIIKVGQLKLKVWTFSKSKSVEVFTIKGFFWCFTISTLIIYARIILVITISILPESMIL